MDYKLKRQLIFGGGFIIVVILLSSSAYQSFKPKVSCSDGIRNQGEKKTDCGGPCAACKEARLRDIEILSYRMLEAGDSYDAAAQVRNANSAHGVHSLAYAFRFYDGERNMFAERTGSAYVLAGQTRYIIESGIPLPSVPAFVSFAITPGVVWNAQDVPTEQVVLPVFSKKFEKISAPAVGFAKVSGIVENKKDHTLSLVDVQVVLVDKDAQPIAVGKTQLDNLRFGESRSFTVLFPAIIPLPADIYTEAMANVFEAANVR